MQQTLDRSAPTKASLNAQPHADDWHRRNVAGTLFILGSEGSGLSAEAPRARLSQYGPNELVEKGVKSPLAILWEQFTNVMVRILIAAAGLSLFLGKFLEAGAILAIVVLFAILGFLQEYRAERAIAALKKLAVPNVRTYRSGRLVEISARKLVPGDVIALEAGNVVPADVRLTESVNLRIQESALTGEFEPIEKHILPIDMAQWQSMLFTTLAFLQVFQALATRSNTESLFTIGVFSNRVMWGVIGVVVSLQLVALCTPLGVFLGLQPLTAPDLLLYVGLGLALFTAVEVEKLALRHGRSTHRPALQA
jgi:magnesium-transporting ATPase (P-type)